MEFDLPLMIFLGGFAAMLILRVPIAFGMLATATLYLMAAGLDIGLMAEKVLTNLFSVFIIIAVPLFVFTAKVMNSSKVSDMIYDFAHAMVGKVRGGLGHVNVIGSLIFSGMTGSAVADVAALLGFMHHLLGRVRRVVRHIVAADPHDCNALGLILPGKCRQVVGDVDDVRAVIAHEDH